MHIQMKYLKFIVFSFLFFFLFSIYSNPLTINELLYGISLTKAESNFYTTTATSSSKEIIIAIDPGHGGEDTGAIKLIDETSVINSTTSHLFNLLKENEYLTPVLTKDFSEDKTISQRAEFINEIGADLVISIHANSDSSQNTHGFECYPTPPGRLYSNESMQFAKLITGAMQNNNHTLRGETGIKFAYYNNDNKTIVDSSDDKVRSSKSFGIVDKVDCPSVLVEQCFISSWDDVNNWADEDGSKKAAEIYYKAICDYFSVAY